MAPQAVSIGLRNCYVARFGRPLSFQSPAAAFEGLWTAKPSTAACKGLPPALPWYLLIGSTSCLYWPSKLLRGTFWAPLKSLKSPAAAFEGLWTAKPSAAACEGLPLALPWYLPRPHKLFLLGFETATWHVLRTPYKPQKPRSPPKKGGRRHPGASPFYMRYSCGNSWDVTGFYGSD